MPDGGFETLRDDLLRAGMSLRYVRRAIRELEDHREDLLAEAAERGVSGAQARKFATERIGDQAVIARHMVDEVGRRSWASRYPRLACICLPVACCLLLPLALVTGHGSHSQALMRWGTAMMLSAAVTALMLLSMRLAIVLG